MFRNSLIVGIVLLVLVSVQQPMSAEIANSEAECKPLSVGSEAPDAELIGINGQPVSLKSLLAGKPTVLVFFRGTWCPLCTQALSHVGQAQSELKELGFQIVAVSSETPKDLAEWEPLSDKNWVRAEAPPDETKREKFERERMPEKALDYPIVTDPNGNAAEAFGIAFHKNLAGTEYARLGKISLIPTKNGRSWLPLPSVFLIDASGVIRFVDLNRDKDGQLSENYTRRIKSDALLRAAREVTR